MEFDLQRFDDEQPTSAEPETSTDTQEPIPEELGGLGEDYAREAMAEWEETKNGEQPEEVNISSDTVSRADYQAKVDEAEQLKAQIAQYQNQNTSQQQFQLPQVKITPEISAKINEAIKAEAMNMAGFSEDDVASLEYADDDDPRIAQWEQAKSIAQNNVLGAITQARIDQQRQVQQFMASQTAAVNDYNEFAKKEFKEPDFKEIQNFATNEFFSNLAPAEQKIIANSYLRIERQVASPAEMLLVKKYYEKAKAAYRGRRGKMSTQKNSYQKKSAGLPRVDQLGGVAGKGEITVGELENMLETTDFDKIPKVYQNKLLGY